MRKPRERDEWHYRDEKRRDSQEPRRSRKPKLLGICRAGYSHRTLAPTALKYAS